MANYNVIKKIANQNGVEGKITELHDIIIDCLNDKFSEVKQSYLDLEVLINKVLAEDLKNEENVNSLCFDYVLLYDEIEDLFNFKQMQHKFKKELDEILEIYVKASCYCCGSASEVIIKANVLMMNTIGMIGSFVSEYAAENLDRLSQINDSLSDGLEYIFMKIMIQEQDLELSEKLKENIEKVKRIKFKHIQDVQDMERKAIESGYEFKSQNGSHKKFEHKVTHKCIIIPQHRELKFGTSLGIQRQILENAIA